MNEMRKLMEAIEQINEDPSVSGNLRDIQRMLTDLSSLAGQFYWNYEKYPQLAEYQVIMQEVQTSADILRKKVYELR